MGLILDTSIVVAAERRGQSPSSSLAGLAEMTGDVAVGLSVLTVFELMHGVERARTPEQAERQQAFVDLL